jgi:hypothetical protein
MKCFPLLFLVMLLSLPGYSGEGPDPSTQLQPSHRTNMPTPLRIIIRWSGDDFASKQDLEARGKIETLIAERGVGRIVRRGTGMGWMDIWVEVGDRESAKIAIDKIMGEVAPEAKYLTE